MERPLFGERVRFLMKAVSQRPGHAKPLMLTKRHEEILQTIRFYRYMTALDVTRLLYSPSSLGYVRSLLTYLSGGADYQTNQYLYRFPLLDASLGNPERVYTLGSKGRDFLARETGLPVDWYYRPHKVKHFSFGQVIHSLTLTRFLVAAHAWCAKNPGFKLVQTRISYDLVKTPAAVEITRGGRTEKLKVIPDAWLLFEQIIDGRHGGWYPVLLEIDRGTEYQQKFKQHVQSRIEFIRSGAYREMFANEAVTIAYATTGERPEYRGARRAAMCAWTQEVLVKLQKERWASVFRFCSLCLDDIYTAPLFAEPVWYRPDQSAPVPLFAL